VSRVIYQEKEFKSVLNRYRFIDSWFWCRYSLNTYSGCEHACTYCDSRSHKYHLSGVGVSDTDLQPDFDQLIYVKKDVAGMLDTRISRARKLLPDVVAVSGVCDPYQPAEREFGNTRASLEVLLRHGWPVFVSTKSGLVTRDADLLSDIAGASWCAVAMTITTTDEKLATFLEPRAPLPRERFAAIRELKKVRGLQVGVNLIPVVPLIGDSDENLEAVTKGARDAGADFVLFGGGMTMRDNQALWFTRRLREEFGESLAKEFLTLYDAEITPGGEFRGKYAPKASYCARINRKLLALCEQHGLAFRIRRFIPGDFRRENYIIAEEMLNEAYLLQSTGRAWSNLFWAGQNINNLAEPLGAIAERRELRKIRNVNEGIEARILKRLGEM
jgi:DNA repair photolyase